jgi:hypothetical protein
MAIHSHMLTEQPCVFFVRFWANDDALKLAKGLRAALENDLFSRREGGRHAQIQIASQPYYGFRNDHSASVWDDGRGRNEVPGGTALRRR